MSPASLMAAAATTDDIEPVAHLAGACQDVRNKGNQATHVVFQTENVRNQNVTDIYRL